MRCGVVAVCVLILASASSLNLPKSPRIPNSITKFKFASRPFPTKLNLPISTASAPNSGTNSNNFFKSINSTINSIVTKNGNITETTWKSERVIEKTTGNNRTKGYEPFQNANATVTEQGYTNEKFTATSVPGVKPIKTTITPEVTDKPSKTTIPPEVTDKPGQTTNARKLTDKSSQTTSTRNVTVKSGQTTSTRNVTVKSGQTTSTRKVADEPSQTASIPFPIVTDEPSQITSALNPTYKPNQTTPTPSDSSTTLSITTELPSTTTEVPFQTSEAHEVQNTTTLPSILVTTELPSTTTEVPFQTTSEAHDEVKNTTTLPSILVTTELPSTTTEVPFQTTSEAHDEVQKTTTLPSILVTTEIPSTTTEVPFQTTSEAHDEVQDITTLPSILVNKCETCETTTEPSQNATTTSPASNEHIEATTVGKVFHMQSSEATSMPEDMTTLHDTVISTDPSSSTTSLNMESTSIETSTTVQTNTTSETLEDTNLQNQSIFSDALPSSTTRLTTSEPENDSVTFSSEAPIVDLSQETTPRESLSPVLSTSTGPSEQLEFQTTEQSVIDFTTTMPSQTDPTEVPRYPCVATVPRLNLHLEKMLGEWYPAKISATTLKLWTQSFEEEHNASSISCLVMEYTIPTSDDPDTLNISLSSANESTGVEALFVGDDKHPKQSKWAISWPNGEDTLTSVVAAGVVGTNRNQYNWLLTVDCDLNGIVEPDWAVMARKPEGISNSTLTTILAIVEGLKGLTVEDAITYQSDDCQK